MENQLIKYDDEYYVCVSNAFVKANQDLNPVETKLLRLMISQIVKTDEKLKEYTVSSKELSEIFGNAVSDNFYRIDYMEQITRNLLKQIIKIDYGKKRWDMFQIFSKCKYDNGLLTMQLHDEMKPFLIALKDKYTQYQIGKIIGMSSNYAIRIFELIQEKRKSQQDVKFIENYEFTLEELRTATNTIDKLKQMVHFKTRVLDIAMREITYNAGYSAEYKEIKNGRKIIGFVIELHPQYSDRGKELLEKYGINAVTGMYYKYEK